MKRSVRSGIAIAGLAGGFWLLGQAVANADETAATGAQTVSTTAGGGGGGSADSSTKQNVEASNTNNNTARTGDIDASGGTSHVTVNAGNGNTVNAGSDKGAVKASQNVTNVVWISSEANGGTVSGSNNAAAGNGVKNTATATGTQKNTTTGGDGKKAGEAESKTRQHVEASNFNRNDASTGDIDVYGGTSDVDVNAGNHNHVDATTGHDMLSIWTLSQDRKCQENYGKDKDKDKDRNVDASQTVNNKVTVSSEANGGSVSGSNNAAAGNGTSNTATASGSQTVTTTGGNGKEDGKTKDEDWWKKSHGGDAESNTHQSVESSNTNDNTARTGDIDASGGHSIVSVNAGNGNTLYCTSVKGNVNCSQSITNIINIISQANGGSVSCSNNAFAGNAGMAVCPVTNNNTSTTAAATTAAATTPAAAAPAALKAAAAPATKVSASSSPSGTLAFTGAETSLPLTLGLLALGMGGALTLAGRRRQTATV